jgi:cbb3-type cytochrome oxidase subunit 3
MKIILTLLLLALFAVAVLYTALWAASKGMGQL